MLANETNYKTQKLNWRWTGQLEWEFDSIEMAPIFSEFLKIECSKQPCPYAAYIDGETFDVKN